MQPYRSFSALLLLGAGAVASPLLYASNSEIAALEHRNWESPRRTSTHQPFNASDIPPALLLHADQVLRDYRLDFQVLNLGEALETEHFALTLLNENAADELEQSLYYSSLQSIEDIEGAVYDTDGTLFRKIKKSDIQDQKPFEYFVSDYRMKNLQFPRRPYPFTIEYTVKRKHKGLMFYPLFMPQDAPRRSVEKAVFRLVMPDGMQAQFKEMNLPPGARTGAGVWELLHLPALQAEPFMPSAVMPYPFVLCSPAAFSMAGYEGDLSSWDAFGRFIGRLNSGLGTLPAATAELLRQRTADCPDAMCKIERVYAYLQENTRYFNVSLGIGGWQPMDAQDVDKFKYSDCKGLSNYTVAMLRSVGLPAYYALIRAGSDQQRRQFPDFPNAWFNHAVVCVALPNDTIWLECTSQSESCGFNSDFTDNRPALLITETGGKLVYTPRYNEQVNVVQRNTRVELSADGSAQIQSEDRFAGLTSGYQAQLAAQHPELQKKSLYQTLSLSDFEIKTLELSLHKKRIPEVFRKLELAAPRFAAAGGKRLFVPLTVLSGKISPPGSDSTRLYPVQADGRGFTVEDRLQISLPEGYAPEAPVEPQRFESAFGTYELSVQAMPGKIEVLRRLSLNDSVQPKEQYEALTVFLKKVAKADKGKLVLVKKT